MEQFIARQPIFDSNLKVYAYELLFRSGVENFFEFPDGDQASARLIINSLMLFGMESMTGGAKAFINFTRKLIVEGLAEVLPHQTTVVELLEDIPSDQEVVKACAELKRRGFALALDDFVARPGLEPLLDIADFIKVDWMQSPPAERADLARQMGPRGLKLLAEKVETPQEYEEARALGYTYYQGYFFAKPVIVSAKDIPPNKFQLLQVIREINRPDLDFKSLSRLISDDVNISFKLLRYINSAAFCLIREITSIEQALHLLGEREIRKWATLVAMAGMGDGRPQELLATSLVRARLAESIAEEMGLADRGPEYFIMGLFSLLDTFFGRPLEEVLVELPIDQEITGALLGKPSKTRGVLELITALEAADWPAIESLCAELKLDPEKVQELVFQAIQTSREVLTTTA